MSDLSLAPPFGKAHRFSRCETPWPAYPAAAVLAVLLLLVGPVASAQTSGIGATGDACGESDLKGVTVWSGSGLTQNSSDASEKLVLRPDPGLMDFAAGGGDDVLYVLDPPGGQSITAGPGADTIVVCRMTDLLVSIKLGDETTGGADLEDDRVVLGPAVFQGVPDGFVRHVMIFGISPQNDRVELRLPPGIEAQPEIGGVRAGSVFIDGYPGSPADRIAGSVYEIVRVDDGPYADVAEVGPALSAYYPERTCADTPGETFAGGREEKAYLSYTQNRDVISTARVPGRRIHHAWDGRDLAYVESSQGLFMGRGADQVVVCSLDDPETMISLGPGGANEDFDPDVVVVEAGRFQDGVERKLEIHGASRVNDRIILRLPPGVQPRFEKRRNGVAFAEVGDLSVSVGPGWQGSTPADADMFVVERVAPVRAVQAKPGELPDLSTVTCPDPGAPGPSAEPHPAPKNPLAVDYSPEADSIVVSETVGIDYFNAREGDDRVFVFDPLDGALVYGDRGSDVIVVCSIRSLSLVVAVGDQSHTADATPDAVILESAVFLGVPRGARRQIDIHGFVPRDDRLVLRLPRGMKPSKLGDTGYGSVEVVVGDVLVRIYRVDDFMTESIPPDAIQVVAAAGPAGPVTPVELPPPNLAAAGLACPEPGEGGFAEPTDAGRTSYDTALFDTGPDRILIDGHPGWVHYYTWDGDDTVFVTKSIPDLQVHLGRGADTVVVCSTAELSLGFDFGPHDAAPDTLVLGPEAFMGVPSGYERRYLVSGVVEGNDRIVIDPPPGMDVDISQPATASMLQAKVGRTTIMAFTTGDAFGRSGDRRIFVASGSIPRQQLKSAREPAPARKTAPKPAVDRPAPAVAWSFDPSVGMEGQAAVTGTDGSRLEIVCGNSGGPSLAIVPDPRRGAPPGEQQRVGFRLEVRGRAYEQDFLCAADGNHCSVLGIPSLAVLAALRSGSHLTIREGEEELASYSLKGSNAAISRLSACLQ